LQDPIHDPPHGFQSRHLFIQFLLLTAGEFLPPPRRFNPGLEAMQKMAHLIQAETAGLR
jgi:hypothetical protein